MDENTISLFSSKKTDNWLTPPELYDKLDGEFHFSFDPCPLNSKFNGLKCNWGLVNFVNPPYSKVKEFLIKAWDEIEIGNSDTCVFLTFANTDTQWFHDYIYNRAEIRFIKGRLRFLDVNGNKQSSAMRPSMIAILRKVKENRYY